MAWLATLLTFALLAVMLGVSLGDRSRPPRWARVWGGPTAGPTPLSLRVELVEAAPRQHLDTHLDARIRLVDGGGKQMELPLSFDAEGQAYVMFPEHGPDPTVSVLLGEERLASGPIRLTRASYFQQRQQRGGWWRGKAEGDLRIAVGCSRGVLALGHAGTIGIAVANPAGQPVATELTLLLEGLAPVSPVGREPLLQARPVTVRTNARGEATLEVVPKDLSASLRVVAGPIDKPIASFAASIPVESVPIVADLRDGQVVVDSLIPIPRLYYALVNEQGRWAGGGIDMLCDTTGRCHGQAAVAAKPTLPAWLMVGSEPALDGPNVVGWPLTTSPPALVSEAVMVRDRLLLDGRRAANGVAERRRVTRFERVVFGVVFACLVLLLTIALELSRGRRNLARFSAELDELFPQGPSERLSVSRPASTISIVLLVVFGLVALVAWIKGRISGF
jgi:hypothetical protein